MPLKKIYTIIVNHNEKRLLKDCLKSLQKVKLEGFVNQIILIDNASWDGSVRYVKKRFPDIKIKIKHQNLGFSGGVNLGLLTALKNKAKYVLLLNNDTIVTPNFLQKMVDYAEKKEKVGIFSPLILLPGRQKRIWFAGGTVDHIKFSSNHVSFGEKINRRLKNPYETEFVPGCAMLIKRKVIEKVGFFDERFFLYYEDVDYCLRAKKEGFKCKVVPEARITHRQAKSEIGDQREYYLARNHLLFLEKHAPPNIKAREYASTVKAVVDKYSLREDPKISYHLEGIKDYFLRRFGKREHWY